MKTNKTYQVFTTYDSFSRSATVKSPKTGRVLRLDYRAMKYVTPSQFAALSSACGGATRLFTAQDLRDFLEASEASRDEYKDGLIGAEVELCVASEENDGECPHCESIASRRF